MAGIVLTEVGEVAKHDLREARVARFWLAGIFITCALFSLLHHCCPTAMNVPVASDPVPYGSTKWTLLIDLNVVFLSWMCLHHAWRRLGVYRATFFFGGTLVLTGVEESLWVLLGRVRGPIDHVLRSADVSYLGEAGETYYFTRGTVWFLETPLTACMSWFLLTYACLYAADLLIPRARVVWRAALAGLLAVNLDMLLDPVQTHEAFQSWVWCSPDAISLFGIPLTNYIGWFLIIFIFGLVFARLPTMISRHGPGKAAVYFMTTMVACAFGVMLALVGYAALARRSIEGNINLTLWGIGS